MVGGDKGWTEERSDNEVSQRDRPGQVRAGCAVLRPSRCWRWPGAGLCPGEVLRRCVVTISGWQIAGPVDEPHPALAPRRLRLGSLGSRSGYLRLGYALRPRIPHVVWPWNQPQPAQQPAEHHRSIASSCIDLYSMRVLHSAGACAAAQCSVRRVEDPVRHAPVTVSSSVVLRSRGRGPGRHATCPLLPSDHQEWPNRIPCLGVPSAHPVQLTHGLVVSVLHGAATSSTTRATRAAPLYRHHHLNPALHVSSSAPA